MGKPFRAEFPCALYHITSQGEKIGKLFRGIHYSALNKISARLKNSKKGEIIETCS